MLLRTQRPIRLSNTLNPSQLLQAAVRPENRVRKGNAQHLKTSAPRTRFWPILFAPYDSFATLFATYDDFATLRAGSPSDLVHNQARPSDASAAVSGNSKARCMAEGSNIAGQSSSAHAINE